MRIEAAKGGCWTPVYQLRLPLLAALRDNRPAVFNALLDNDRGQPPDAGTGVQGIIEDKQHFPGRERDEKEVLGYYAALERAERIATSRADVSEIDIRTLHALVMGRGNKRGKPTPYRDGQNVIRDSRSRGLVYMPPEAKDVPPLMKAMSQTGSYRPRKCVAVPDTRRRKYYQFATIHPYYDAGSRTRAAAHHAHPAPGRLHDLKGPLFARGVLRRKSQLAYYEH